jgi:5-carboxymethyl-2-hydroxymuconate isomerase
MPHLRIEYSENLRGTFNVKEFCTTMHGAIMTTGLFELGAVRVRAYCAADYAVADLMAENSFVDMHFRVGQGRNIDELKKAGETIFATAKTYLTPYFRTPHFALSLSIDEINGNLSWKQNVMHTRLR